MSIRTIGSVVPDSGTGMAKKIDSGAQELIFDVLQRTQYSTPIPSTVRELTTNALDAQKEKQMAREILEGRAAVEDYYIHREGDRYADSNWDPTYHDLSRFDPRDGVDLVYTRRPGSDFCDLMQVIDYGVGIGGTRLEKLFSLGFSTKRNTQHNFGAFGLGAKVAFSTGVPMYTVDTVHSGRRVRANCYPYKTVFVIPPFNLTTGRPNPTMTFSDGTVLHYEETEEFNRTIIEFGVKRHNRSAFETAVTEQLLYLKDVVFTIKEEDEEGNSRIVSSSPTSVPIIYNSKNLLFGQTDLFHAPHIVIVKTPEDPTGINYGAVDFRELEMEQLHGCIGFKCPIRQAYRDENGDEVLIQDGVNVIPSREKVIWDEHTRAFLQGIITGAVEEANALVEETMKGSTEFYDWLLNASRIAADHNLFRDTSSVMGRMGYLMDRSALSPKWSGDPTIKFGPELLGNHTLEGVLPDGTTSVASLSQIGSHATCKFFYKDANYSKTKLKYLYAKYGTVFILEPMTDSYLSSLKPDTAVRLQKRGARFLELMDGHIESYDAVEVPADFYKIEAQAEEQSKASSLSPSQRRALHDLSVGHVPMVQNSYPRNILRDKVEFTVAALLDLDEEVYLYTLPDAVEVEEMVMSLIWIADGDIVYPFFPKYSVSRKHINASSLGINLLQVSQEVYTELLSHGKPHILDWKELFCTDSDGDSDGAITVHSVLQKWYTIVCVRACLGERFESGTTVKVLDHLGVSHETGRIRQAYHYLKLINNLPKGHAIFKDPENTSLFKTLSALEGYNVEVARITGGIGMDPLPPENEEQRAALANLSFRHFIFSHIQRANVRDVRMYMDCVDVLEFIGDIQHLLNHVDYHGSKLDAELLFYLRHKGKDRLYWSYNPTKNLNTHDEL